MRYLLTLLFFSNCLLASSNPVQKKLSDVNKLWQEQDTRTIAFPAYSELTPKEWIKLHLSLVEKVLLAKDVSHLSPDQEKKRRIALSHLHGYWVQGAFPKNEDLPYRTPIFIDKYDNFCAVGYLIKASGYEDLSRKIAEFNNLAYVRDMHYSELDVWATEYGFTTDELAWIQPSYAPPVYMAPVGTGITGTVHELYVDPTGQNMYVGGSFTNGTGISVCNNIARVTNTGGFAWHNMGSGVNGRVDAIAQLNGDVFVAGAFTNAGGIPVNNVAYWDGTSWYSAGCLNGTVKDLTVSNGKLYASGQFDICSSTSSANFAVWSGTDWRAISGVIGIINTMEVYSNELLLGGNFYYNGNKVNVIRWNDQTGYSTYSNSIVHEVNDFELLKDTLYLACKRTIQHDSSLIQGLVGNTWYPKYDIGGKSNVVSLTTLGGVLLEAAVDYDYNGYLSSTSWSFVQINNALINTPSLHLFIDSTSNKVISFRGNIIFGGLFSSGIGKKVYDYPASGEISLHLNNCDGSNGDLTVNPYDGFAPYSFKWSTGDTTQTVLNLSSGNYFVTITDSTGDQKTIAKTIARIPINKTLEILDWSERHLGVEYFPQATYQWLDCSTGLEIPDETSPVYKINKTGSYACIIKLSGCNDTTDCTQSEPLNVQQELTHNIAVYPNPVTDLLQIDLGGTFQSLTVDIKDMAGRTLLKQNALSVSKITIDVKFLPAGVYSVVLEGMDRKVVKIVKY